jgi:hypothetical protein
VVDVLKLLLAVCVHGVELQDRVGARLLVGVAVHDELPAFGLVWADQG